MTVFKTGKIRFVMTPQKLNPKADRVKLKRKKENLCSYIKLFS